MKRLKLIAIASVIASPLLAQEVVDSAAQAAIQDEQALSTPLRWDICSVPYASGIVLLTRSTMRFTSTEPR